MCLKEVLVKFCSNELSIDKRSTMLAAMFDLQGGIMEKAIYFALNLYIL